MGLVLLLEITLGPREVSPRLKRCVLRVEAARSSSRGERGREREQVRKVQKGLGKCVGCTVQLGKAGSFLGIQQLERDYL
jgi:hypothetical protein